MSHNELELQEKREVDSATEPTRDVPVYTPAVDIYETREGLVLIADVPGVNKENVEIDLKEDRLTIHGVVTVEMPGEKDLIREYGVGDFRREFTVPRAIDREKIVANMKNGVLTVVLPKMDALKPRKIEVKTG